MNETAVAQSFDVSGRRIPPDGLRGAVNKADARYALSQPAIDYAMVHARITEHIGGHALSAAEFEARANAILAAVSDDEETAPLARAVRVPFLLAPGNPGDLGKTFETTYLHALGRAWKARFPKSDFKTEVKNLAGRISIANGSRYDQLIAALQTGPVVGWYFPLALSGYSIDAALAQMTTLPPAFTLAGGFEAAASLVGSPDLMMSVQSYPPQLDLSAWAAPVERYAYHFAAYGYNLTFNGRYHNGLASDYCASGLTVFSAS